MYHLCAREKIYALEAFIYKASRASKKVGVKISINHRIDALQKYKKNAANLICFKLTHRLFRKNLHGQ